MKKRNKKIKLLSALLVSGLICSGYTYAYYNSNYSISELINSKDTALTITNGQISTTAIDSSSKNWTQSKNNVITSAVGGGTVTSTYGPIQVKLDESSMNSNLQMKVDLGIGKTNDSNETKYAEPFEVVSGDIDNFGLGFKSNYNVYSGVLTSEHAIINDQSSNYDSLGTDKTLMLSGFKSVAEGKQRAEYSLEPEVDYYLIDGRRVFFDGYGRTQVNASLKNGKIGSLRSALPLNLKYESEGRVTSAVIQIFVDDLQSGESIKADQKHKFVSVSASKFRFYLQVGDDKNTRVEIEELSNVLNSFNQSGPKGNIVTLNVPQKYLKMIEDGAGLDKGLKIIIDDPSKYTSADGFAIDFAKLTVNALPSIGETKTISVSGQVKDGLGNALAGVEVVSGDGQKAVTDSKGNYTLKKVLPGIVSLTFSKEGYMVGVYGSSETITSDVSGINMKLDKAQTFTGNIIIKDKANNEVHRKEVTIPLSSGINITEVCTINNVVPGEYYNVYLEFNLPSREGSGYANPFTLDINGTVQAIATQENNPAWDESGKLLAESASFVEEGAVGKAESKGSNTTESKVYFQKPSGWKGSTFQLKTGVGKNATTTLTNNMSNYKGNWYVYEYGKNTIPLNSSFNVSSNKKSDIASGNIYYFGTQKIYICTE